MRGGQRGTLLLGIAALAALLALVPAAGAAKKKRKRVQPAVSVTAPTPISPGSEAAATATCPSKTHVTGGGWSLSNPYTANGSTTLTDDTGTRINHLQSQPASLTSWTAGAAALGVPANGGTFSSIARCETNKLGRTTFGVSGSTTVPIGQESTNVVHCSPGTHVLNGGFSFSPSGSPAPAGFRALVVESRRSAVDTWQVDLVNPAGAPAAVTLTLNILCEVNRKGLGVSETSSIVPIVNDSRATAIPTCSGKTHATGGGFVISPMVGPAVGIDQMLPVGTKSWQIGLYEYPGFNLPAGSSLAGYAYCKKNAPPRKRGGS
jgi:hypothetical protein